MAEGVVLSGTHLITDLETCLPLQGHGMEATLRVGDRDINHGEKGGPWRPRIPHILKESEG